MSSKAEQIRQALRAASEGNSYEAIARKTGSTEDYVRAVASKSGLSLGRRARKYRPRAASARARKRDQRDLEILTLLDAGKSRKELASQFNVCTRTVANLEAAAREAGE